MSAPVSQSRPSTAAPRGNASSPFATAAYETGATRTSSDVAAVRAELKGDIRTLKARFETSENTAMLAGEIAALREMVEELTARSGKGNNKMNALLRAIGVEGAAATAVARALKGKSPDAGGFHEALPEILKTAEWPVDSERALVALVGPSGVGKTTTAAKLAARARMLGRSVTLIGCDSFRVGATEQLARYARLMGAEMAWAKTPDQLRASVDGARTDFVIIDTSGKAPTLDGVESALAPRHGVKLRDRARHVLLCVPASVRAADASRIAKLYGVLGPTSLASTKLDETETPAGLVHAGWAARLPYSVLCFGQRVPEDVGQATPEALSQHLAPSGSPRGHGKAVAA